MKYRVRENVVLSRIAGVNLLIPLRSVYKDCAGVFKLDILSFMCWRAAEQGTDVDQVCSTFRKLFFMDEQEAMGKVKKRFETMAELGYIIPVEEN